MHKFLTHKVGYWLLRFVQFQLFISLVSLPIITSWGLPFSLMSFMGNLIFSPILTLFLLICTIIFFMELVQLPTSWLMYCLELLSSAWMGCIGYIGSWSFVYFPKPPVWWCLTVPLLALVCIHHKKLQGIVPNCIALSMLLIVSLGYLKIVHTPSFLHTTIPCNNGSVTILHVHGTTTIIDPACIGQRKSALSWVEYNLVQTLVTTIGNPTIDHLVLLKPNKTTLRACTKLLGLIPVKKVYLVPDHAIEAGPLSNDWQVLNIEAQKQNTSCFTLSHIHTITLDTRHAITLEPYPKVRACLRDDTGKKFIYPLHTKQRH